MGVCRVMFFVVIEHLESCINKWILLEYKFVIDIFGRNRVLISNIRNRCHEETLKQLGVELVKESATEWLKHRDDVIVLDPRADRPLTVSDLQNAKYVVIGGIMGDHPPRGRTHTFITSKMNRAKPRNLGPYQLTIFGAAYILKEIERGRNLDEIPLKFGLEVRKNLDKDISLTLYLPYAFPIDEKGTVVLPPNYLETIIEIMTLYEVRLLRDLSSECMCYDGS